MADTTQTNGANDNKVGLLPSFMMKSLQRVDLYIPVLAHALRAVTMGKVKKIILPSDIVEEVEKLEKLAGIKEFANFDKAFAWIQSVLKQNPQWLAGNFKHRKMSASSAFGTALLWRLQTIVKNVPNKITETHATKLPEEAVENLINLLGFIVENKPDHSSVVSETLVHLLHQRSKDEVPRDSLVWAKVLTVLRGTVSTSEDLEEVIIKPHQRFQEANADTEDVDESNELLCGALVEVVKRSKLDESKELSGLGKYAFNYLRDVNGMNPADRKGKGDAVELTPAHISALAEIACDPEMIGVRTSNQEVYIPSIKLEEVLNHFIDIQSKQDPEMATGVAEAIHNAIVRIVEHRPDVGWTVYQSLSQDFTEYNDAIRKAETEENADDMHSNLKNATDTLQLMVDVARAYASKKDSAGDVIDNLMHHHEKMAGMADKFKALREQKVTHAEFPSEQYFLSFNHVDSMENAYIRLEEMAATGLVKAVASRKTEKDTQAAPTVHKPNRRIRRLTDPFKHTRDRQILSRFMQLHDDSRNNPVRQSRLFDNICSLGAVYGEAADVLGWYYGYYRHSSAEKSLGMYTTMGLDTYNAVGSKLANLIGALGPVSGQSDTLERVLKTHFSNVPSDYMASVKSSTLAALTPPMLVGYDGKAPIADAAFTYDTVAKTIEMFVSDVRVNTRVDDNLAALTGAYLNMAKQQCDVPLHNGEGVPAREQAAADFPNIFKDGGRFVGDFVAPYLEKYTDLALIQPRHKHIAEDVVDGLNVLRRFNGCRYAAVEGLLKVGEKIPATCSTVTVIMQEISGNSDESHRYSTKERKAARAFIAKYSPVGRNVAATLGHGHGGGRS